MIRYIPINKECEVIPERDCFAFFNTVTNKFIELAGSQVFESIQDLEEAWNIETGYKPNLDRLIMSLRPDLERWAKKYFPDTETK